MIFLSTYINLYFIEMILIYMYNIYSRYQVKEITLGDLLTRLIISYSIGYALKRV